MKNSHLFSTIISQTVLATGLLLGSAVASASTVGARPVTQDVFQGETVFVGIVAEDLVNTAGGSMDVSWDPTVLTMSDVLTDVVINTAVWDDPDTSNFSDRGVLSSGLLSGLRVGTFTLVTGAAPVATLTFTAIGVGSSLVTVGDGAGLGGGWSPPIDTYNAGTVNVNAVPVPAAVWLFGSGLLGLVGIARRKKTA